MRQASAWHQALVRAWRGTSEPLRGGAALVLDGKGRVCARAAGTPWPFSGARVGQPARSVHPEPLGQLLERLWDSAAQGHSPGVVDEIGLAAPDGTVRRLSVRVGSWRRHPALYTVTVRDVTDVYRHVHGLSREVERLQREKARLEESIRGLAHDIRSPLSGLCGLLAILDQSGGRQLPERASQLLRHCRMSAERLEDVVRAALEERPRAAPMRRTDIVDLASAVLVDLRHAYPQVPFTFSLDGSEVLAAIPSYVLWRVLWNLAANAVAYRSPERPLHVVFRAWRLADGCMIEFRDNGVGLVPGEEEEIFASGRRGSNISHAAGTGLGLHHARGQLGEWDGRIWAEPRQVGAAFLISLPGAEVA